MSFDPKITKVGLNLPIAPASEARESASAQPPVGRDKAPAPLAAPDLEAARAATKQKEATDRPMPRLDRGGTSSRLEQRFAELELALAKKTSGRAAAAKSAMAFAASHAARGSRGARARTLHLCELMDGIAEHQADAYALRLGLRLDEAMQAGDAEGLLGGLTAAAQLEEGVDPATRGFVMAQSSEALAMLAEHFPATMEGIDAPLDHAFSLAEEALSLAPELAEAHVALAQLILLHGDHEAMRDAESLTRRALELEPNHDGATFTLATLAYIRHDPARALELLTELQTHGTARPQVHLLMARAQRALKALPDAYATLTRALATYPGLLALHVEAHVLAKLLKDEARAAEHRQHAADLAGPTIDLEDAIELCFAGHSS